MALVKVITETGSFRSLSIEYEIFWMRSRLFLQRIAVGNLILPSTFEVKLKEKFSENFLMVQTQPDY